jgi:glycosyltransferase involved in cell wall biosynthesis
MNEHPLVTIVCLCYNQANYVSEAIDSVQQQSWKNIQLIIVDDASTDNSREVITERCASLHQVEVIFLDRNVGNCRAFNLALQKAKGEFLIDLAADDMLVPERVAAGVTYFHLHPGAGAQFSDAKIIDKDGAFVRLHSDIIPHDSVPQGDIYADLIQRYFICSPTLMFRKRVFDQLSGYDETLFYEDFDFLIRSSRTESFGYLPEPLVCKRMHPTQMSREQQSWRSQQQWSTFLICEKILKLNRTSKEQQALTARLVYEWKHAMARLNFPLAWSYLKLLWQNRSLQYPG